MAYAIKYVIRILPNLRKVYVGPASKLPSKTNKTMDIFEKSWYPSQMSYSPFDNFKDMIATKAYQYSLDNNYTYVDLIG